MTHVEPDQLLPPIEKYDVVILSDYPTQSLDASTTDSIIAGVGDGKRFLMLGGCESFNGFGRNYYVHRIGQSLVPAMMQPADDRVNAAQGLIVRYKSSGNATTEPNWDTPPVICGYNDVAAKEGTETLVVIQEV